MNFKINKIQRQKLSFVGWFSIGKFKENWVWRIVMWSNKRSVYTSLKRVVCRRGRAVYLLSSVKWYLYSLSVWLTVVSWTHLARWASVCVVCCAGHTLNTRTVQSRCAVTDRAIRPVSSAVSSAAVDAVKFSGVASVRPSCAPVPPLLYAAGHQYMWRFGTSFVTERGPGYSSASRIGRWAHIDGS